tara:strand:- start:11471 stop:11821 length:351 start_codon:yes stop_codon:yes gene_type:complete
MATFDTTIPLSMETRLPPAVTKQVVTMQDGTSFVEVLSTTERVDNGQIVCIELTETEKDAVISFYNTNKDIEFTFTNPHDGLDYDLYFIGTPPEPRLMYGDSDRYTVTFYVMGVKS